MGHFSSVWSKQQVISHTGQTLKWRKRRRCLSSKKVERSEQLFAIGLSVSIFHWTPFSLSPLSGQQLVLPFSTLPFYEMCFTGFCQVPHKISPMHKVQGAFQSFLILYYAGNTSQCSSVLSSVLSATVQHWRALVMMRREAFLCKPATWGLRLASLAEQGNSPQGIETWR